MCMEGLIAFMILYVVMTWKYVTLSHKGKAKYIFFNISTTLFMCRNLMSKINLFIIFSSSVLKKYPDGLRRILCQVGLQEGPEGENSSLVDKLMLSDSKLWKGEVFMF